MTPCAWLCVPQVIHAVLMQGRAFLSPGIPLTLVMPNKDAVAMVDKVRLTQIITNGLRCVWSEAVPASRPA